MIQELLEHMRVFFRSPKPCLSAASALERRSGTRRTRQRHLSPAGAADSLSTPHAGSTGRQFLDAYNLRVALSLTPLLADSLSLTPRCHAILRINYKSIWPYNSCFIIMYDYQVN